MSHINYDPENVPDIDVELIAYALATDKKVVIVSCYDPEDLAVAVQFLSLLDFVPRVGERIILEDGTQCRVMNIIHKVVTLEKTSYYPTHSSLVVNVYSEKLKTFNE